MSHFRSLLILFSIGVFIACQPNTSKKPERSIESVTLLGDTLFTPKSSSQAALNQYANAKADYEENPYAAETVIWYSRRMAYLGRFQEAIQMYTKGIEEHPKDARMYRHRGHRYISTRQYDKAIADFEKAVSLIEGQPDQVEPDGLPNSRNIPLSTLHGNIWYHLGLAYYLNDDMDNALKAYSNRTVTERYPDNLVSGGYWLYMINRRLGHVEEANKALEKVEPDIDIIENMSYQ